MLTTLQAVLATIIALLPGAILVWSFETRVGSWWQGAADRVYRFVGWSAVLHALAAPLSWIIWRHFFRGGDIYEMGAELWLLWPAALAYLAVPLLAGQRLATVYETGRPVWLRKWLGEPAPTAWDRLWSPRPLGWVRIKLKDGPWIAGIFGTNPRTERESYAAGYPNRPDLYLSEVVDVDPKSGMWLYDGAGNLQRRPESGLLISYERIEFLEFVEDGDDTLE